MPAVGDRVSPVGPWTGLPGLEGPPGPMGGPPDPAANVNGRNNAGAWVPVLPLTGGEMSAALNLSGITLTLYDAGYDVGGAMTFNSAGVHQFWSGSGECQSYRPEAMYFQTDGWRLQHVGGGQVIYYDSGNNPRFGWWGGNFTTWGNAYTTSYMQMVGFMNFANIVGGGFRFTWNGEVLGQWADGNGTLIISYNLGNACDMRLKQDIKPSRFDCLAALRRMRLYQFRWRARGEDAPLVPVGFVAQRLEEDFPETVRDLEVETNVMLAALVGAVQQLDRDIAELEDAPA